MHIFNQKNFNLINLLNFFIVLLPLSFIIGNFAINANVFILVILGLIKYGKETFFINNKLVQSLVYAFFIYLILVTWFNNYPLIKQNILYKEHLLKSLYFLRFLIFYLVINKLIEKEHLNINNLIYSIIFFTSLISFDLIFQLFTGKNLIGLEIRNYKLSSIFGEEQIAGGYLQKFSLFLIFFFLIKLKKNYHENILVLIFMAFFLILIIMSGNRMPVILFIFSFVLYFSIEKKLFLILSSFAIFFCITLYLLNKPVIERQDYQIKTFFFKTKEIIIISPKLFWYDDYPDKNFKLRKNSYLAHFNTGIQLWKKNKIFGSGLKSFKLKSSYGRNLTQNNHPHNYFIEILLDTGLVGLLIIYGLFFIGLKKFYLFFKSNVQKKNRQTLFPFFILIFLEFFPLRSSGSFFSTGNASFIFFFLAFFLNCQNVLSLIKNYKK